jgi:hypothetical protein
MGIDGVGSGKVIPIEWLRRLHEGDALQAKASPKPRTDASEGGMGSDDSIPAASLSEAERARLISFLKEGLDSLPDVRRDKVIEAKLRISTGYYEREEIRREILRSVLQSLRARTDAAAPGATKERATETPSGHPADGPDSSGSGQPAESP